MRSRARHHQDGAGGDHIGELGTKFLAVRSWLKKTVRKVARIFAEEIRRELETSDGIPSESRMEVDIIDKPGLARLLAEEIRRELETSDGILTNGRMKFDVVDTLKELASGSANEQLQRFYFWNHRWAAILAERNRRTASETWDFIDGMDHPLFVLEPVPSHRVEAGRDPRTRRTNR